MGWCEMGTWKCQWPFMCKNIHQMLLYSLKSENSLETQICWPILSEMLTTLHVTDLFLFFLIHFFSSAVEFFEGGQLVNKQTCTKAYFCIFVNNFAYTHTHTSKSTEGTCDDACTKQTCNFSRHMTCPIRIKIQNGCVIMQKSHDSTVALPQQASHSTVQGGLGLQPVKLTG